MHVRAMRRTDAPSPIAGVELVRDIDALVDGADHIVLAAPATARTKHLIDAERVRGGEARRAPRQHRRAARWSIRTRSGSRSTTAGSPSRRSTPSIPSRCPRATGSTRIRRCSSTAHVSWYTPELQRTAVEIFVDNLGRFLRDEPLLHVVDRDEGY